MISVVQDCLVDTCIFWRKLTWFFMRTESLRTWYEKYIKIFLTTWNQLRVSLATNGKYKHSHCVQHFLLLYCCSAQLCDSLWLALILLLRWDQDPSWVLPGGPGSQQWLQGAVATATRPRPVLYSACQLPHRPAQWPDLLCGQTHWRGDQVGALMSHCSHLLMFCCENTVCKLHRASVCWFNWV